MDCVEALALFESDTGVSSNGLEAQLVDSNNIAGATGKRRRSIDEWERLSTSACTTVEPGSERVPTDEVLGGDEQEAHDICFDAAPSGDITKD